MPPWGNGCGSEHLRGCREKNESDGKVHEQWMQSTDERHVIDVDRTWF
jgi:hypothetical protein